MLIYAIKEYCIESKTDISLSIIKRNNIIIDNFKDNQTIFEMLKEKENNFNYI